MPNVADLAFALPAIARAAIASEFGIAAPAPGWAPALEEPAATFVTLRCAGELRGCIGSLEPRRPLRRDVHANALAAAFHDPRFAPLRHTEYLAVAIEVSLLGPSVPLAAGDEDEALRLLTPGVDGVILECGAQRATFLPQVWEQLPEPRDFLAALKRKAGLAESHWSDRVRLARYTVTKYCERATEEA